MINRGRDNVVGIATRIRAGRIGVRTPVMTRDFIFPTYVQSGPGTHTASCKIGTR